MVRKLNSHFLKVLKIKKYCPGLKTGRTRRLINIAAAAARSPTT